MPQSAWDRVDVAGQAGNRDRVGAVGANRCGGIEAAVNPQRAVWYVQRTGERHAHSGPCWGLLLAKKDSRGVFLEAGGVSGRRNRPGVGDRAVRLLASVASL